MPDLSFDKWKVMDVAVDAIRDNYATIKTTIETEQTGYPLPTLLSDGSNVYAADGRTPPQASNWVWLKVRTERERKTLNHAVSRSSYLLTARCCVKHQGLEQDPTASPIDVETSGSDAGWKTVHLMARAVEVALVRHVPGTAGIFSADIVDTRDVPQDPTDKTYYAHDVVVRVRAKTYNAALTA